MSIKSLLQLILLLLIFIILGSIYYMYFYSGPLKNQIVLEKEIGELVYKNQEQNISLEEKPLEESDSNNIQISNSNLDKNNTDNIILQDKANIKVDLEKNTNLMENISKKKIDNLTKEIEYITSNKNGDTFKIFSKYGKTNLDNSNILDLEDVKGNVSSKVRSDINIISKFAMYNYNNQNSKFYNDVEVRYDGKTIFCDNLDLNISDNIAVAYGNVLVKDNNSLMKAQIIILDTLTKDIKINSKEKIKIFTK